VFKVFFIEPASKVGRTGFVLPRLEFRVGFKSSMDLN